MNPIPMFAEDLIKELDKTYPRPLPTPSMSRDESMFNGGRRELIETLLARLELTIEEGLKGDIEINV